MRPAKKDILFSLLLLLLVFLLGCSPKVVSYFFDGVPVSDTVSLAAGDSLRTDSAGSSVIASAAGKKLNMHPPYELKKCNICHSPGSASKLSQPEPGLCYLCHDDFSLTYKIVHGPAEAGYCTNCHRPHSSENPKLLRRTGQLLCLECHAAKDVFKKPAHAGFQNADCLVCHNPHGGNDRNLLR